MANPFKQLIATVKTVLRERGREARNLTLGPRVIDDEVTRRQVFLSTTSRTMHVAMLGKSGSGKSSLLKHMSEQDIESDRGFVYFDLHGDATPFLLKVIAARER